MTLTKNDALAAVELQQAASQHMNVLAVQALLNETRGTTFASAVQVTPQTLAAAHKDTQKFLKVTVASLQLFNNLKAYTNAYTNAVKRTAGRIPENDAQKVAEFEAQGNWFEHTDVFSVVKHKSKPKYYLFSIYNRGESLYVDANTMEVVSREHVAKYCTPSEAKKVLEPPKTTYNVTNDITHAVTVRTVSLDNIVQLTANNQTLQVR